MPSRVSIRISRPATSITMGDDEPGPVVLAEGGGRRHRHTALHRLARRTFPGPAAAVRAASYQNVQYSFLMTKYEPRMVPASFDFWRANLKRDASSSGTSMPSDSLNPTARFSAESRV